MLVDTLYNEAVGQPPHQDLFNPGHTIAIIGPGEGHREEVFRALVRPLCVTVRHLAFYPRLDTALSLKDHGYDVLIIDVDTDTELALKLIDLLSLNSGATIMASSAGGDADLVIRCMHAGAREFLTFPLSTARMQEALDRCNERKPASGDSAALGRMCVFLGAKGGAGTTTIASNFAFCAARESDKETLLIDLDLPLGDAVLNFGVKPEFSTLDALSNYRRLDKLLLSRFLTRHESGVSILAAPGKLVPVTVDKDAIDKLIQVARREFECVVIDAGSRFDLSDTALFQPDSQLYLVTQLSVSDLRNSNRIATEFLRSKGPRFEVVVNRYSDTGKNDFTEEDIHKALFAPPHWRVPNDYAIVHKMQTTATPLATGDSSIARTIRQMARAGLDLPAEPEKKKKKLLGLF